MMFTRKTAEVLTSIKGATSYKDIHNRMQVSSGKISHCLNELEDLHLIKRSGNRRCFYVNLTKKGDQVQKYLLKIKELMTTP